MSVTRSFHSDNRGRCDEEVSKIRLGLFGVCVRAERLLSPRSESLRVNSFGAGNDRTTVRFRAFSHDGAFFGKLAQHRVPLPGASCVSFFAPFSRNAFHIRVIAHGGRHFADVDVSRVIARYRAKLKVVALSIIYSSVSSHKYTKRQPQLLEVRMSGIRKPATL